MSVVTFIGVSEISLLEVTVKETDNGIVLEGEALTLLSH